MYRRRMRTPVLPLFMALTTGLAPISVYAGESVGDDNTPIVKTPDMNISSPDALKRYADNLTAMALKNEFPEFVGESELKRKVREQLRLPGQESMFLLGPRGSGKTSLVQQMAKELAPEGYVIWSLQVGALQAGSMYRGDLENRIQQFLKNFDGNKKLILYIDEFHSAMEVSKFVETIKPLMSSKRITLIAGTTEDEFAEYVEKNKALTDRAPKFIMEEFTLKKTIEVLTVKADKLEKDTGLEIGYEAIERAAKLAMLYYPDESPSRASERILSRAAMRKQMDKEGERFDTLKIQDDIDARHRAIARLQRELGRKSDVMDISFLNSKIKAEKAELEKLTVKLGKSAGDVAREQLQEQMATVAKEIAAYKKANRPDLEAALERLREEYHELEQDWAKYGNRPDMDANELRADDIGKFVAQEVGITVETANESDAEKLARLEKGLRENLFGQDHVIEAIVTAVRNRLANIDKYSGPIAVMLFDGPRGTGKTTVERILTEVFYGNAKRVVRVTMNTGDAVGGNDIWGPRKGIVDSETGGQIEGLRRTPHSLLAIEEADKGPGGDMDQFLQAWDEGKQKDSRGRMVNFTHTLVTITANLTGSLANVVDEYFPNDIEKAWGLAHGTLDGMGPRQIVPYVLNHVINQKGWSEAIQDRITVKVTFNRVDRKMAKAIVKQKLEIQAKEIFANHRVLLDYGQHEPAGSGKALWDVIVDNYFDANQSGRHYIKLKDRLLTSVISGLFTAGERFEPGTVVKVAFDKNEASTGAKGEHTGDLIYTVTYRLPDEAQLFKDEAARQQAMAEAKATAEAEGHDVEAAMIEAGRREDAKARAAAEARKAAEEQREKDREAGKVVAAPPEVHVTAEQVEADPTLAKPGVIITEKVAKWQVFMSAVDKPTLAVGRNAGGAGRAEGAASTDVKDGSTSEIKGEPPPDAPPEPPTPRPRGKARLSPVKPGQHLGKR